MGRAMRPATHGFALTLGLGLILLGLASCSSTLSSTESPTATASPTAIAVAPCQTTQLTLGMQSQLSGASNFATIYRLDNTSRQSCTLEGYPEVHLLTVSQQPLTIGVNQQTSAYLYTDQLPQRVTLAPAASAYFILEWNAAVNGSGTCPGAAFVVVTPPGNTATLRIASKVDVCTGSVIVSPIEPTAFGSQ
ncbi:MAG TPA: DUF4232 domain-containing protein [Ktedonobacterales bacterium]|nr:DUF4232 domain-containing protein [Ktedonobacterales bacterium]